MSFCDREYVRREFKIKFYNFCFLLYLFINSEVFAQVPKKKLNVLYLSFCSVDTNFLPYYSSPEFNSLKVKLPNITKVFDQSVLFKNSVTDFSWSTARRFIYLDSWRKKYGVSNKWQDSIHDWEENLVNASLIRIPVKEDFVNQYNDFYNDDRLVEPFDKIDEIFKQILIRKEKRGTINFWMLHFKLMHYPYLSESYLKSDKILLSTFNKRELEQIKYYLKNPNQYPDKYPFFQVLFGEKKLKNIFMNKQGQYVSFLTSEDRIKLWRKSKNYQLDLNILKKSYQLRLLDLDKLIGELFLRYKQIEKDTVLVIGGDHGETVFEHDYLSHGHTPYDEVIKFFHAIHFPNQTNKISIDTQFSQASLGAMIEKINSGSIDFQYFSKKSSEIIGDGFVLSYSCAGDVVSLRDSSGWKYILFINDQREYLYNIKNDPRESINVLSRYPNIANRYRTEINNQLAFKQLSSDGCLK